MPAKLIDGLAVAKRIRQEVAAKTARLRRDCGIQPCLAVVLVGDNPASQVYVRNKGRVCDEVGFRSIVHKLPADTTEAELLALIDRLNADREVNGILVQLPLPQTIHERAVIDRIDPAKDVDGFHPENVGRLAIGLKGVEPCTPKGAMILLREACENLTGKKAVVIGRSNIVGKPMALMLLQAGCTVTVAHSKTRDLKQVCADADIVVAAVGRVHLVKSDWIKPGAIVIDIGINRIVDPDTGATKLTGDVDFEAVQECASALTPVPGGVGPMTIACLMENTLEATLNQKECCRC